MPGPYFGLGADHPWLAANDNDLPFAVALARCIANHLPQVLSAVVADCDSLAPVLAELCWPAIVPFIPGADVIQAGMLTLGLDPAPVMTPLARIAIANWLAGSGLISRLLRICKNLQTMAPGQRSLLSQHLLLPLPSGGTEFFDAIQELGTQDGAHKQANTLPDLANVLLLLPIAAAAFAAAEGASYIVSQEPAVAGPLERAVAQIRIPSQSIDLVLSPAAIASYAERADPTLAHLLAGAIFGRVDQQMDDEPVFSLMHWTRSAFTDGSLANSGPAYTASTLMPADGRQQVGALYQKLRSLDAASLLAQFKGILV